MTDFVECEMFVCVAIIQDHNLLCRLTGDRMGGDRCLGTVDVAKSVGVFVHGTSHLRELK